MMAFRPKHRNWKWIIYSNHDLPRGLDTIDIKVDASKGKRKMLGLPHYCTVQKDFRASIILNMGNLALENEKVGSDIYVFLGLEESAKGALGISARMELFSRKIHMDVNVVKVRALWTDTRVDIHIENSC
ncbi:hypothetical protein L3X38_042921 [Prunus dulcis]|uniref:Uncharacterized protein n=1 Tax=Prunus dulcis TaxID=3755 RepID=A0AAD4UVS1_PRUDU|nr:hypothetical protein L3X38_042921 [Prunus dulcis]